MLMRRVSPAARGPRHPPAADVLRRQWRLQRRGHLGVARAQERREPHMEGVANKKKNTLESFIYPLVSIRARSF